MNRSADRALTVAASLLCVLVHSRIKRSFSRTPTGSRARPNLRPPKTANVLICLPASVVYCTRQPEVHPRPAGCAPLLVGTDCTRPTAGQSPADTPPAPSDMESSSQLYAPASLCPPAAFSSPPNTVITPLRMLPPPPSSPLQQHANMLRG
jgi:hypothetical protein